MISMLAIPDRWRRDFRRLVSNFNYEWNDDNDLLISNIRFDNYVECHAPDGLGWQRSKNAIMLQGKNHVLDVVLHGTSAVATWYVAPFSGNVTIDATFIANTTGANFHATVTELGDAAYTPLTNRVAFDEAAASAGSITNTASPATITAAADSVSLWGVGLLSTATKQNTSGSSVLLAASKYTTARTLSTTGDTFGIKWTLSL